MKNLLLLAGLGILGYYGYNHWFAAPEPPPTPAPKVAEPRVAEPKPAPVSFAVKSRVERLLEEWKRRSLGGMESQISSAPVDVATELAEIRKTLFRDGIHSQAAVLDVIKRALRELGVAEKELNEVAGGILGMR